MTVALDAPAANRAPGSSALHCRVGGLVLALPEGARCVRLRVLTVLAGARAALHGLTVLDGRTVPVVDFARLLGDASLTRFDVVVVLDPLEDALAIPVEAVWTPSGDETADGLLDAGTVRQRAAAALALVDLDGAP